MAPSDEMRNDYQVEREYFRLLVAIYVDILYVVVFVFPGAVAVVSEKGRHVNRLRSLKNGEKKERKRPLVTSRGEVKKETKEKLRKS